MTVHDFIKLSDLERLEKIYLSSCLAKRADDHFDYELYQIDGFYVEASFQKDTFVIEELKVFSNPSLLLPYLEQIDITDLL